MKKGFWFQVHWLLGIVLGIVIAIVGVTGAALSFQSEILDFINKDIVYVKTQEGEPLGIDELLAGVSTALPNAKINSLTLSSDIEDAVKVNVSIANSTDRHGTTYYVNQYTAELLPPLKGESFFRVMIQWHRWIGFNGGVGKQIVAIATVALIVLSLTGLYLYWPLLKHNLRSSLSVNFFKKKGRGFLYKLHSVFGIWTLVFVLLMSFSGLFWSYDWYRNGLFYIAGVEQSSMQKGQRNQQNGTIKRTSEDNLEAAKAYALFQESVENGYKTVTMSLPNAGGTLFSFNYFDLKPAHSRATNQLQLDTKTGEVTKHAKYEDKKTGEKFISSIFSLHSGDFFGVVGLVLYFVSSLAMALFAITGYMLYYDRFFKNRKKAKRKNA